MTSGSRKWLVTRSGASTPVAGVIIITMPGGYAEAIPEIGIRELVPDGQQADPLT